MNGNESNSMTTQYFNKCDFNYYVLYKKNTEHKILIDKKNEKEISNFKYIDNNECIKNKECIENRKIEVNRTSLNIMNDKINIPYNKNQIMYKNIKIKIHNIISSINLERNIDLRLIAISIRNAEYNPKKVNTLIIRLNKPNCTALIFQQGRIMLTGAKTISDSLYGCKKIAKIIKKVTNEVIKFRNFKIENIIATANCYMPIRLELLANDFKENCNYEPELFAGLVYRYNLSSQFKSVILIFVSGKIVITGCKTIKKLQTVFEYIYNLLLRYKC